MPRKAPNRAAKGKPSPRGSDSQQKSPSLTAVQELNETLDDDESSEQAENTIVISPIDITSTSLKIGWSRTEPDTDGQETECYLLQWRTDGSDEWSSLPETVTVPRVRLEQLQPNTRYSFRVKAKPSQTAPWSNFCKTFTFSTLLPEAEKRPKSAELSSPTLIIDDNAKSEQDMDSIRLPSCASLPHSMAAQLSLARSAVACASPTALSR
jgi:hypothetical protein